MHLYDVNLIIAAHNAGLPNHLAVRRWFEQEINGVAPFGMSELVLSAYLRIVTNPKAFSPAVPIDVALANAQALIERPNCMLIRPGPQHFGIFTRLCREVKAKGNLISDAYLAALAIENGCRWYTFDRDFARFQRLDWAEPDLSNLDLK
jgi:uncharacterized protein